MTRLIITLLSMCAVCRKQRFHHKQNCGNLILTIRWERSHDD